ncbi:unnamed protein product [Alopecurus aequalis]
MNSSSTLLSLILVLACSSVWGMSRVHGGGLENIRFYMYETAAGNPDATVFDVLPPLQGGNTTFGIIRMFDNVLGDGPDPSISTLLGRFQGFIDFTGIGSLQGKQSVVAFVFTSGDYSGSTLVISGIVQMIDGAIERPIVGGTGVFRMARGYSLVTYSWNPTTVTTVYEVNLFVELETVNLLVKADS